MKKQIIGIISLVFACAFTGFLLVAAGYFYLDRRIKVTEQTVSDVPYEFALPENKTILFTVGESRLAFYLDFTEKTLYTADVTKEADLSLWPFGKAFDYQAQADREWLGSLIDSVGGITLSVSGERLRYTGTQITEMFEGAAPEEFSVRSVLEATIRTIAETGLTLDNLKRMIKQADTNLKLTDCALWEDYIGELFSNAVFTGFRDGQVYFETVKEER